MEVIKSLWTNSFCKRLLKPFALLVFFLLLQSCKSLLIKFFISNPVVVGNNNINDFINSNSGKEINNYVLKIDNEEKMFEHFFNGVENKILIFNSEGNLMQKYENVEYCEAKILSEYLVSQSNFNANYEKNIKNYISNVVSISNINLIPNSPTIILYWNMSTGKRGYNDLKFIEDKIEQSKQPINIMKINTDFNKDWGLIEGAKIRYKVRNNKLIFEELPYEN